MRCRRLLPAVGAWAALTITSPCANSFVDGTPQHTTGKASGADHKKRSTGGLSGRRGAPAGIARAATTIALKNQTHETLLLPTDGVILLAVRPAANALL
jgi:hypothetical protein